MEKETPKDPNDLKKRDLRVIKTYRALFDAMFTLLNHRNFNDITINDLCSVAMVSRATLYAHFNDKYDLMKYCLTEVRKAIIKDVYKFEELEKAVNGYINANKKVITNILKDANSETLMLIREFMSSIVDLTTKRQVSDKTSRNHIILFNFFIGGLVNLLTWMVENDFPPEINMMNNYLYKLIETITNWDANQEQLENAAKLKDKK